MFDKTIREAHLIYAAIHNSHNLHSTITERLQKYTDLKEELVRIWQLKKACIIPLVLSTTGISPNKLHDCLKVRNLLPVLYILISCFCGLEVVCWPLVPNFAGSNPSEAVGFFRAKKSSARLPSEGK